MNVANIESNGTLNLHKTTRHLSATEVAEKYSHFLVDPDDLVIASSGVPFDQDGLLRTRGAFVRSADLPLCLNTSTIRFKALEGISDLRFLRLWLNGNEFRSQITKRVTGTAQQNFGPSHLKQVRITLPPLAEQRRIAEVLDRAEALRAQRRAALTELEALLKVVFVDLFGDPISNERKWPEVTISDFVAGFEGGRNVVADDEEDSTSPYRVLKVSAVTSMTFRSEESKAVPPDYEPPRTHFVCPGDLLFSRANTAELVGATAYVWETPENLLLPDKLWRFRWKCPGCADPLFVWHLFQQPRFRREIGRRATGTSGSMKNISQEKVLAMRTGFPPIRLQREFARHVAAVERLKAAQRASLAELDALFASLQHRAFRGEL